MWGPRSVIYSLLSYYCSNVASLGFVNDPTYQAIKQQTGAVNLV